MPSTGKPPSRFNGAGSLFIDPGSRQNAWIESFNGRLRDELLNSWQFDSLLEVSMIIEDWRSDYNANRPHSAHDELTPTEFALQWTTTHQPVSGVLDPKPHSEWTTKTGPPHDELANFGIVRFAVSDGVIEDCRIGGQTSDRELVDVALESAAIEQLARDVIEPDALSQDCGAFE